MNEPGHDLKACHDAIAQEALACLPDTGWQSVRIECALDGQSTDILFEYVDRGGTLSYVTRQGRLPALFITLSDLMCSSGAARWTVCHFAMTSDLRYQLAFHY